MKTTPDQKTRIRACKALAFLNDHPAFSGLDASSICSGMWFYMTPCCKRGYSESSKRSVRVWRGSKGWRRFKSRFDKEYAGIEHEMDKSLQSVDVPYEERFGEPWVFDHVEYWYELTFSVFMGDPYRDRESHSYKKWDSYQGVEGGAKTFDDMLIHAANAHRRYFGNFARYKDFHTPAELRCQRENVSFVFKPLDDSPGLSRMIFNPKHVSVSDGLTNVRWLKWFVGTDYARKHWKEHCEGAWREVIERMEKTEPAIRKKRLAKYM